MLHTTQRIRRTALFGEPLRNLPVVLTSLLIVMAAVDVLLVIQPSPVRTLRDDWQRWVKGAVDAPWATLVGAGAIIACVAVAAALLTVVVRGISESPYLWIASALVAGCCFWIGRMAVEVPVQMPTPWFAALCALLLVGGGAFFQGRSFITHAAGTFLASMPLMLVGVGYWRAQSGPVPAPPITPDTRTLLSLLAIATVGTPLVGVAARRLRALGGASGRGGHAADRMVELIERARTSERRAVHAERELQRVMRGGQTAPRLHDDDELVRPKSRNLGMWMVVALAAGGAAAAYMTVFRPLQMQLSAQRKLNHEQTQLHAAAIAKLRADFDRQRLQLQGEDPSDPAAAPGKGADASAAAHGGKAAAAKSADGDASKKKTLRAAEASPSASPRLEYPKPGAPAAEASPSANPRPEHAKPTSAEASPSAASPRPEHAKPAPAAKPAARSGRAGNPPSPEDRALQSNSDDPIEGLDGL